MIIKIKTTGHDNWRFYDNATAVQSCMIKRDECPQLTTVTDGNNFGFDNEGIWEEVLFDSEKPTPEEILLISFCVGDINGKPINLYTNGATYLLNNEGKTIERIY